VRQAHPRRTLAGLLGFVAFLHLLGWGVLLGAVVPGDYRTGGQAFGVGLGVAAYLLGMRHAFDADHLAAIDNTTRKLMSEGQRPVATGFWFSLGHSSVVFVMTLLLALGLRAFAGEASTLAEAGGLVGTLVSGGFLLLIGVLNLVILWQLIGVARQMRAGAYDEQTLEEHLARRGVMARLLRPAMQLVRRPVHLFPLGLLFGLGFDTVTEIALLATAGGAALSGVPWWAVLTLPVLFAAGMSLMDTLDGYFMTAAYGWAFTRPVRKVFYNLVVTALSVAVALGIGLVELGGLLADQLGARTGLLAWMAGLDLGDAGYLIVGLFAITWALAAGLWHWGRIEERWEARAVRSTDDASHVEPSARSGEPVAPPAPSSATVDRPRTSSAC